ncbi:MAG TPA: malto-oligosyltrehalose trehalohydrolase [Pirellulales bacterium]|jgi:maltooligosyltrehalose trehalohydrolase|nr:malto-oligosyltrehalose trehalohydrolase [Pirellulales bacterium]
MPLSVWAPNATSVELEAGGRRSSLIEAGGGWWQADFEIPAGADYAFRLSGGPPRPDPRSAHQPQGVHGPSRRVDHGAFEWDDPRWQAPPLPSAIIYELHIGTFTQAGTFAAAMAKLPHLAELGVTHVELMPVNEFAGMRGWGYDGVDLFAPHHAYGGPEGLKQLVAACHRHGLAVLIDVVYNHLGPVGNYLGEFGPYFTDRHRTPWGQALNFDGPHSDEVRRFFVDNALMWLRDYHADGLRLDALHAIVDTSATPFLEQLADEVADLSAHLGRHLVLVAESDLNDPRVVRSREIGGFGYDAQWSDDFHHALHTVLTGERQGYYADFGDLADLAVALQQSFVYAGRYSHVRRRSHGRATLGLSGHRFLGFLQNHDQLGNRAQGDRSSHLMSTRRLKIGAALVLASPFIPMLFQGEEWGATAPFQFFTDFDDPQLAQAVREGRAREFASFWSPEEIPDPQDPATFERSKLNWQELGAAPHAELLDWHKRLIALRRREPALTDGRLENVDVSFDEQARWLVVERGEITLACNLAEDRQLVPVDSRRPKSIRLASVSQIAVREDAVELPPDSVVVLGA